jgi:ABC-type transporter Mla subunit MlaD
VRRLAIITLIGALAGIAAVLVLGTSAQGSSSSRVDVIFDDARGLVSGQLLKIAGAQAGTIENVVVTPDFKARIEASVESRFMPFHEDATCTIRPEGLIAENYVECDPGSAGSPPLQASGGNPPTVPVTRTTEPVALTDLFDIFNLPTSERLTVLVNELGVGTSGRGTDFNAILRRANPSLTLARQTIGILVDQKTEIGELVDAMHTIAAQAATHTGAIQRFISSAASVTARTADHSTALQQAIARLPGLLAAAQPALHKLNGVAADSTPLVRQLGDAAPALDRTAADLGPFVAAAKPGLAKLSTALQKSIPALRDAGGLVKTLRQYADRARSGTVLAAHLFENLQQHGFVENFLSVVYYIGASLSRFDSDSHLLSVLLEFPNDGLCALYATAPVKGCSAHYGASTAYAPSAAARTASPSRRRRSDTARTPPTTTTPASTTTPATTTSPATPSTTTAATPTPAQPPASQASQTLQSLIDYLLK